MPGLIVRIFFHEFLLTLIYLVPQGQGLSGHLEVPLPYLLYRAQRRFEEDLKGLGALTPITALPQPRPFDDDARNGDRPDLMRRISNRTLDTVKMSSSFRLGSPRIARARLNSLGSGTGLRQLKGLSSSTLTLQGVRNKPVVQSQISSPSNSDSESNEEAERADDEARRLEEQESLEVKLKHLQSVMTSEALGLVRDARQKTKEKQVQRGRDMKSATSPSPLRQTFQRRDLSSSDFNSNTSSPQGSIPSIPSPSSDSLPQSPVSRHMTSGRKASSPAVKSHRPMAVEMVKNDQGSNHGSSASSFESLSGTS